MRMSQEEWENGKTDRLKQVKITPDVLTREQCAEIIASCDDFQQDILKADTKPQSKYFDKETLDQNTVERSQEYTNAYRNVTQCPIDEPIFPEWDGKTVYRCKVMRYETGQFLKEHKDAQWMCLSNYWEPNTNKASETLVSIALNDDFTGGDFTIEGECIAQELGSAVEIPQYALPPEREKSLSHGVSEISEGTRYALVFWTFA